MEQIPTEVMEKIMNESKKRYDNNNIDDLQDFENGAAYGYCLASPCALCEGKEKEIAELRQTILIEFSKGIEFASKQYESKISELEAEKKDLIAYTEYVNRVVNTKGEFPMPYEAYK